MRKILYSPGFGAGWTTWNSEYADIMIDWPPIVAALENNETLTEDHSAVASMLDACKLKAMGTKGYFSEPYLGGMSDLRIYETKGRVHIEEYDGSERVFDEGVKDGYWL